MAVDEPIGKKYNAMLQRIMLRVKDPKVSIPFYEKNFGMKCVHQCDFPSEKYSVYFLEVPRDGCILPSEVPSSQSEKYIQSISGCTLELTHNWGTESDPSFKGYWSGNHGKDLPESSQLYLKDGPNRGFSHIAFNVEDLKGTVSKLEENGVAFQQRPQDMWFKRSNMTCALDPDGYWIAIVQRESGLFKVPQNLSQVMFRVNDGETSMAFYRDIMGLSLALEWSDGHYLLMNLNEKEKWNAKVYGDPEKKLWQPALGLISSNGAKSDDNFQVHTGNEEPCGFGHVGFLVDDLDAMCAELDAIGVSFFKRPSEGNIHNIAFILDPSGYRIELIQRNMVIDPELMKAE
jgi:lactoylglutathione lyase